MAVQAFQKELCDAGLEVIPMRSLRQLRGEVLRQVGNELRKVPHGSQPLRDLRVSMRVAPGSGTMCGDNPASHASATSNGVAPHSSAIALSTGLLATRERDFVPPSGRYASNRS